MNEMSVRVKVTSPARGGSVQASTVFTPAECVCTWSWGLQPATALIDWVSAASQPTVTPDCTLEIEVGGHTFYGICRTAVPVLGSDGYSLMQEFVDNRYFLMGDMVYGMFNVRQNQIVNGRLVRRYRHILPWDFNTGKQTYTTTPYTAGQIMAFCLGAPTVATGWYRTWDSYAGVALEAPVYGIDWTSGRKLGQALLEVSERIGTTFTLMGGPWTLYWSVKGIGNLPEFPANSDHRRGPGQAVSGNPTRVRLLGDRNRYQVLNLDLSPDWKPAWGGFWDFAVFVHDIFAHERTEAAFGAISAGTAYTAIDEGNDNNAGWLLARARAETMTVEEYARLRDARDGQGEAFRDYRRIQGRSRLTMPVALYVSQVLFRAYRPPVGFVFRKAGSRWLPPGLYNGIGGRMDEAVGMPANERWLGLTSVELLGEGLVQVTHDPSTGVMYYDPVVPSQPNGYAIAKGFGVAQDAFKTLKPEYFNVDNWLALQAVWAAHSFHIDDSGEGNQFIYFDEPMVSSADLITMDETGKYPVVNGKATISHPPVRAALTFVGERFTYWAGEAWQNEVGIRDEVEVVSGLNGEFVLAWPTWAPQELTFADGLTANQKALRLALPLLNRQYRYDYGGYTVQGSNATQLSSMIDRVTVRVSAGGGLTEEVDFTAERGRNVSPGLFGGTALQVEPERDFDRRAQLAPLLPGQAELRNESNQLRSEAAFLLKHPRISRQLSDTFHLLFGLDRPPEVVRVQGWDPAGGTAPPLPVGTPLWRESTDKNAFMPDNGGAVEMTDPVFVGVTVMKGDAPDGPVRMTRLGNQGQVFVRAKGPVAVNDGLGIPSNEAGDTLIATDYLVANSKGASVLTAMETVADGVTQLIQAKVSGAGTITEAPASTSEQRYRVKVVFATCVGCHTMNGSTEGPAISLVSVAVVSGGTGYTPHSGTKDLTLAGGTSTTLAVITATIDSSGVITSAVVKTAGSYSITPDNPVAVDSGDATFTATWTPVQLQSATVSAAGSNYLIGDILTVAGGTHATVATVQVAEISNVGTTGQVVSVRVICPGSYTVTPSNPNSVTGGSGSASGCHLTLKWISPMTFIAKTPELRSVHTSPYTWSEIIEGISNGYTWGPRANNADGQRIDVGGGQPIQREIVIPIWHVGDTVDSADSIWSEIWADTPTGGIGAGPGGSTVVDPFGNAITLMDKNKSARRWNQIGTGTA